MTENPYAPPTAAVDDVVPGVDPAARIRQEHLLHEIRVKSIGTLYLLSSSMFLLMIVGLRDNDALNMAMLAAIAVAFGVLGYGFRRLRPWVLVPGAVVGAIGLLAFPLGTLINAYILYLVVGTKGRTVLGKDYAAIVAATPTLKYRRAVSDWIAIGVLAAILLSLFLLAVFG